MSPELFAAAPCYAPCASNRESEGAGGLPAFHAEGVTLFQCDCMELMRRYPDKAFDLAIVDPPYGIGESGGRCRTRKKHNNLVKHAAKEWDNARPGADYWAELRRVSANQIVWGANYFTEHLPPSMGWVFWDKLIGGDFSDGELAFTSFNRALEKVTLWNGNNGVARIHPCQKPVALYAWLLDNYAEKGWRILDTHLGGGSIAMACRNFGASLVASEIDGDYIKGAIERITRDFAQGLLLGGGGGFSSENPSTAEKGHNIVLEQPDCRCSLSLVPRLNQGFGLVQMEVY